MQYVLDASAILAVLNGETGAGKVAPYLRGGLVCTVNYSEVGSKLATKGMRERDWKEALGLLGIQIRNFDETAAILTAELIRLTSKAGISFADRACLALALAEGAPVLTGDRKWAELGLDIKVELFR